MTLGIAIVFIIFFVISVIIDRKESINFQQKLDTQNLNIILVNHDEMNVKAELFKKTDFFKLNDTEEKLSDISRMEFIRYSTNEDYFLKLPYIQ